MALLEQAGKGERDPPLSHPFGEAFNCELPSRPLMDRPHREQWSEEGGRASVDKKERKTPRAGVYYKDETRGDREWPM